MAALPAVTTTAGTWGLSGVPTGDAVAGGAAMSPMGKAAMTAVVFANASIARAQALAGALPEANSKVLTGFL